MGQNDGQGGDGSGNQPPGDLPFTTQPGMGTLKSPDPNQNPTVPSQVAPGPGQVNPVPPAHSEHSEHPQTLAGGHGYQAPQQQHQQQTTQQQHPPHQQQAPHGQPPQPQGAYPQQRAAEYQSRPHPGLPLTPGHAFFRMITRAFSLNMGKENVLPSESVQLTTMGITNPDTQGFLVWRRSILLVVTVLMLPFVTVHAVKAFKDINDQTPGVLTGMRTIHVLINIAFAFSCFFLLTQWKDWRRQRRLLLFAWLIFFIAPFAIFLVPIRELFTTTDFVRQLAKNPGLSGADLARAKEQIGAVIGLTMMLEASMVLAPKAVSLMPGIVRASVATKLRFPGAASPGWLIALIAPLYALLVYVVLIGPFQLAGSGWILLALAGFMGGPIWLAASGLRVARPLDPLDAEVLMKRARIGYLTFSLCGVAFLFVAFLQIEYFKSGWWIARMLLSLGTNVLLLTLIATDLTFMSLDRARAIAAEPSARERHQRYERRLANLVGGTALGMGGPPQQQPGQQPRQPSYHDGPQSNLQPLQRPNDSDSNWS